MRLRSFSIWYPFVLGILVFCWTPDALAGVLGYIKSDISGNSGSWMSHMETAASHLFLPWQDWSSSGGASPDWPKAERWVMSSWVS